MPEDKKLNLFLLKEYRASRLTEVISCFAEHPYDRDAARDCVLSYYPKKDEKSVFRGMVIPTMRSLGLIVGYEGLIRASSNGKILYLGSRHSGTEARRVLAAILVELDDERYGLVKIIESGRESRTWDEFFSDVQQRVVAPSARQATERLSHWLSLLAELNIIQKAMAPTTPKDEKSSSAPKPGEMLIAVNERELGAARKNLRPTDKKPYFLDTMLMEYRQLVAKQRNPLVDIEDLRTLVAESLYKQSSLILTQDQFDELLRSTPTSTRDYSISFGKPMGPEEKLFSFRGAYYRSILIRFNNGKGTQ